MTGDSHERHRPVRLGRMRDGLRRVLDDRQWTAELPRHVLDETGLPRAGRSFQQYWDSLSVGGFKNFYFVRARNVKRFLFDNIFLDSILSDLCLHLRNCITNLTKSTKSYWAPGKACRSRNLVSCVRPFEKTGD